MISNGYKTSSGRILLLLLALSVVAGAGSVSAQETNESNFYLVDEPLPDDVPFFDVDMVNTIADTQGLSQLEIKLTFVHDELQFLKAGKKKFRADYEVKVVLADSVNKNETTAEWQGSVVCNSFKDTKSTTLNHTARKVLNLPPGIYNFTVELKDVETGRVGKRKGRVTLRNFDTGQFLFSDIRLDEIKNAAAAAAAQDDVARDYWVSFEIYNVPEQDTVAMHYEIALGDSVLQQGERLLIGRGRVTPDSLRLTGIVGFLTELKLKMRLQYGGESYDVEKAISVAGLGRKQYFENIDDAIDQLRYIAEKGELKEITKLSGYQRLQAFYKFWDKKDPTPDTPENEYMAEYYRRVQFANKKFSNHKDGWKTEMGMVFIMLGPPDYIDRPYNYNSYYDNSINRRPSLIWQYVNLHRRVVFVYRAGEYRIGNFNEIFDLLHGDMLY